MKKPLQRVLAWLLAAALVIGVLPMATFAADDDRLKVMKLEGVTASLNDVDYPFWGYDAETNRLLTDEVYDGMSVQLEITLESKQPFSLSFSYAVSSEENTGVSGDELVISLDQTEINRISGVVEEETYSNTLNAGSHVLLLSYEKDYGGAENEDCAWMWNLVATAQEDVQPSSSDPSTESSDSSKPSEPVEPVEPQAEEFASGSGKQDDPFIVKTADQLYGLATRVNAGTSYSGEFIRLDADIDLAGYPWTPIGTGTNPFSGNFNGNAHTVQNLTLGSSSASASFAEAGLFGVLDSGTIANLSLTNAKVYNEADSADAGILLGVMTGNNVVVDNCNASGEITNSGDSNNTTGGLVGSNESDTALISNSWTDVAVDTEGSAENTAAGGILGYDGGALSVVNCAALGDLNGNGYSNAVGGIVGMSWDGVGVYNSYSTGNITSSDTLYYDGLAVGAIVGDSMAYPAAYYCFYNTEATFESRYDELDVVPIGFSEIGYDFGDPEECVGMTAAQMAQADFATTLNEGCANKLADAADYFSGYTELDTLVALMPLGWSEWKLVNDKVLPVSSYQQVAGKEEPPVGGEIFASGDGTKETPYVIKTADQLTKFAESVNGGENYEHDFIELGADIDLADRDWTPIGNTEDTPFSGYFDGKNFTISNLTIGSAEKPASGDYIGLFGFAKGILDGVQLVNVNLKDAKAVVSGEGSYVGLLVGALESASSTSTNRAFVDHCSASGTLTYTETGEYEACVGGLVGASGYSTTWFEQYGFIANSSADVTVKASGNGDVYAGGLLGFGYEKSITINNAAFGTVDNTCTGNVYAGGLAGGNWGATINNYALGKVTATGTHVGALIGEPYYPPYNCFYLTSNGDALGAQPLGGAEDATYCYGRNADFFAGQGAVTALNNGLQDTALNEAKSVIPDLFTVYSLQELEDAVPNGYLAWGIAAEGEKVLPGVTNNPEIGPVDPDDPDIPSPPDEPTDPDPDPAIFAGGDGTQDDPFVIRTVAQLRAFRDSVNKGVTYKGYYVRLDADLDISTLQWTPIGYIENVDEFNAVLHPFDGHFDGGLHIIRGLTIGTEEITAEFEAVGLFGLLGENGSIRNLGVADGEIYNYTIGDGIRPMAGMIVGSIDGVSNGSVSVVDNCFATGWIFNGGTAYDTMIYSYTGGLVGANGYGTLISNSWAAVDIAVTGQDAFIGGLLGQGANESAVVNCAAFGSVIGDATQNWVGGLIGEMNGGVYNSYAMGDVYTSDLPDDWNDDPTLPLGALIGDSSYGFAAYNSYFDNQITYADTLVMDSGTYHKNSKVYPLGRDRWGQMDPDSTYIFERTTAAITGSAMLDDLNANLNTAKFHAAETYLAAIQSRSFDSFSELTDSGWVNWVMADIQPAIGSGESCVRAIPDSGFDFTGTVVPGDPCADGHTLTKHPAVPATCEKDGTIEYWQCSVCHKYFKDGEGKTEITLAQTVDPAIGHDWDEGEITTPATCEDDGVKTFTCKNDKTHTKTETIPATGHDWDEGKVTKEATCTDAGEKTFTCKNDETHTKTEEIAALGHTLKHVAAKDPTDTEDGNIEYWFCERCGKYFSDEKGEHEIADVVIAKKLPLYDDVQTPNWYFDAVYAAREKGYMGGIGDNLFNPDGTLERGMVVTVLYRMAGEPEVTEKTSFKDVAAGRYYTDAAAWGAQTGVVNGYEDGTFRPEQEVTRQEMALMLMRYAKNVAKKDVASTGDLSTFRDAADVSAWALDAVKWCVENGILNGDNGRLLPGDKATRAQFATIVMRYETLVK